MVGAMEGCPRPVMERPRSTLSHDQIERHREEFRRVVAATRILSFRIADFSGQIEDLGQIGILGDGFGRDYFIDQKTNITVRERDYRAFHPAIDSTKVTIETRYRGEQWTNGVLSFERSENNNIETGEWMATNHVRSVEHNIELAVDYFQPQ